MNNPTYKSLTLEFSSSFFYNTPVDDNMYLTDTTNFILFSDEYSVNQEALKDLLCFPRGGEVYYWIPLEADRASTTFSLWHTLTGERPSSWEGLFASSIHNPSIRYFHHILFNTIFRRENNNKVNSKELFFLHCIFTPSWKINASAFLLEHIQSVCARGTTHLCIRGLVTSIALSLNLGDKLANLP